MRLIQFRGDKSPTLKITNPIIYFYFLLLYVIYLMVLSPANKFSITEHNRYKFSYNTKIIKKVKL